MVMEETEKLIELMQTSADRLAVNVLEAVTQIIAEKKLVRKLYAEKRNSMDMELDRVCDTIIFGITRTLNFFPRHLRTSFFRSVF